MKPTTMYASSAASPWSDSDLAAILQAMLDTGLSDGSAERSGMCLYKGQSEFGVRITLPDAPPYRSCDPHSPRTVQWLWDEMKRQLPEKGLGCSWVELSDGTAGCVYDL